MFIKNLKIGQKMFLGFGVVTLLMLSVISYTYINFDKQSKAIESNFYTYNVIREAETILTSLVNMETGARGFAITGKDSFLEPFNQGKIDYDNNFRRIKELTADNPLQQDRLNNLQNIFAEWFQWESVELIEGRKKVLSGQEKMEDLIAKVQLEKGKRDMDELRSILSDVIKAEDDSLKLRSTALITMERDTRIVMIFGGIIAIGLAVIIAGLVIRMVIIPVKTVTQTFMEVSQGEANLEVRLPESSKDELGDMAKYFNRFMSKLKELIIENKNQSWLKTGEAELNRKIKVEQDLNGLCFNIINYVAKYMNAQIGALYINTGENKYKLFASYAYTKRKSINNEINLGDGIIGQAALEKQTIIITEVPEDYVRISSGIGEKTPRNILVTPCVFESDVKCVIELGAFHEFTDLQLRFLEQISSNIAIALNSTESRLKMKELLNKTLEQAEELQAQQEELRQNNEELEEQARALRESEALLQSQQEELRVANEELEDRAKNLEQQKNDITSKNQYLKAAQVEIEAKAKALEVANKYKSEFLANMSHELKTPLNSILVLSQILASKKGEVLTDKEKEFAETINSSGKDLLKLINDILDLSKVEAGKLDITLEEIPVYKFAEYVKRTFGPLAEEKQLEFNIEISKEIPEKIISDSQRLQQIINNLLSNAIKFTHKGSISMSINPYEGKLLLNEGKRIEERFIAITIKDTGIGIPLDKHSIIFEAFKQSDGTTSRKYGGTGLGLSISKELAALLGGEILLESKEGVGSAFSLIIPEGLNRTPEDKNYRDIAIYETEQEEQEVKPNFSIEPKPIGEKGERLLLIIEDDDDFSSILVDLARGKGYECLKAKSGREGIQLAKEHLPDAVLLDIGLPDISGWQVIAELKKEDSTKNIPFHIISGNQQENFSKEFKGILEYIKKPVELKELNQVFERIKTNLSKPLRKLLIIDENLEDVKAISKILEERGIEITVLDKGEEAYKLLKAEEFNCVILDLKLKDMKGIEFLYKLKAENMINVPILIYTNDNLTEEEERELQKYTEGIIIKGAKSVDRLVAETSLFLHDIDTKSGRKNIKTIKTILEKEDPLLGKKILIVDDDMRNVFVLCSALEEKGIKTIVGRNGKEAIAKLKENPDVRLILMDVMMPEMDGYESMKNIKAQKDFYHIPIIAITAKAMKEDREKCIQAGADEYLTKPIDMERLISLLKVWLYK